MIETKLPQIWKVVQVFDATYAIKTELNAPKFWEGFKPTYSSNRAAAELYFINSVIILFLSDLPH